MNKLIIFLIALTISGAALSQVGINTDNPQKTLHIDGKSDNPETGAPNSDEQQNDFVVTEDGKVGVGVINPSNKLEVKGNITLTSDNTSSAEINMHENGVNGNKKLPLNHHKI